MRNFSFFSTLLCSAFLMVFLTTFAFATTIETVVDGDNGIVTVTTSAIFDTDPNTLQTGGVIYGPGGPKSFTTQTGSITGTVDTTAFVPTSPVTITTYAISSVTNHRAEKIVTLTPDNTPRVTVSPVEWRGVTELNIDYTFPQTNQAYGRINLYYLYNDTIWVSLTSFSGIALSSTGETSGTASRLLDTTMYADGSIPVKADAVIYYQYDNVFEGTVTANNLPTITLASHGPFDGETHIDIGYSFPSTSTAYGYIQAYVNGAHIGSKNIQMNYTSETIGTTQIAFNASGYLPGEYPALIRGYVGQHVTELNTMILIGPPVAERVDPSYEVPEEKQERVGEPINVANGNMDTAAIDFSVPAPGLSLVLKRVYHSQDDFDGQFGYGWRSTYDARLKELNDGTVAEVDADGVWTYYEPNGDGTYEASSGKVSSLTKNIDNSFTIVRKHGTVESFDSEGKLASIEDRNGNTLTVTYDANGILAAVTHSNGKELRFTSDGSHVTNVTDPLGNSVTYTYDAAGDLSTVTDPLGQTETYGYDGEHNLVTKIDKKGTALYVTYDAADRATASFQEGDVNRVDLDYSQDDETSVTDALGKTTTHAFNEYGLVNTTTNAAGNTQTVGWDDAMNRSFVTDENGNTTEFDYDENNNVIQITDPVGAITTFEYESQFNQVVRMVDPLGHETTYGYDVNGNLTSVIDALGNITQYAYDARGNVLETTDARGNSTQFTYDADGNLTTVTDAVGSVTQFTYDAVGNVLSVTDALGNMSELAYDALNRQTEVRHADGTVIKYEYDALDNQTAVIDATNERTEFQFDAYSRLEKVIDALQAETTYTYDDFGNQLSVIDAKGNPTQYAYDNLHRVISEISALSKTTTFQYDAIGQVISETNPNGDTIEYTYDPRGLVTDIAYPDGTSVLFEYDFLGRRTKMIDEAGQTTYAYDALGRCISETRTGAGAATSTIQYEYDSLGNRTKMINQDEEEITYEYDALNRLTRVVRSAERIVEYEYDAASNLTRVEYLNGTYCEYTYDNRNRVTRVVNVNPNAATEEKQVLASFSYEYDANGMKTKMTLKNEAWVEYEYDAVKRLVREAKERINKKDKQVSRYVYEYTYDALGNRLSMARMYNKGLFWDYYGEEVPENVKTFLELHRFGPKTGEYDGPFEKRIKGLPRWPIIETEYLYNEENQLVSLSEDLTYQGAVFEIKDSAYTHDDNGNMLSHELMTDGSSLITDYTYDHENRLTSVIARSISDEAISVYNYDGTGKRIRVTETTGNRSQITDYYYDGLSPIIERNDNGDTIASYVRGVGMGGGIGSIVSVRRPFVNAKGKNRIKDLYYHYDGMGNVVALSNKRGGRAAKYVYDAFGNELRARGNWNEENQYRFSTKETDANGLVHFGARYYDPTIGRWITKDPMGMIDGPNLYNYVNANPVNYIDEWGEFGIQVSPIIITPSPGVIGPVTGSTGNVNPNGLEKQLAKLVTEAGIKEVANNPTAEINKSESGDKQNDNDAEGQGNKSKDNKNGIFDKIIKLFKKKGFIPKGPNPDKGKGAYVNPKTGRKFHLDDGSTYNELPHIDIHPQKGVKRPKRRLFI